MLIISIGQKPTKSNKYQQKQNTKSNFFKIKKLLKYIQSIVLVQNYINIIQGVKGVMKDIIYKAAEFYGLCSKNYITIRFRHSF